MADIYADEEPMEKDSSKVVFNFTPIKRIPSQDLTMSPKLAKNNLPTTQVSRSSSSTSLDQHSPTNIRASNKIELAHPKTTLNIMMN
eukprot:gene18895-20797_t